MSHCISCFCVPNLFVHPGFSNLHSILRRRDRNTQALGQGGEYATAEWWAFPLCVFRLASFACASRVVHSPGLVRFVADTSRKTRTKLKFPQYFNSNGCCQTEDETSRFVALLFLVQLSFSLSFFRFFSSSLIDKECRWINDASSVTSRKIDKPVNRSSPLRRPPP